MTTWVPDGFGVQPGGDVGGDVQASDSFSVRFLPTEQPDDGQFAMVTTYWYADSYQDEPQYVIRSTEEFEDNGVPLYWHNRDGWVSRINAQIFSDQTGTLPLTGEWEPDEPRTYGVQCQTEFLICTDLDDPGGTEVWTDYQYDTDDARSFDTVEAAAEAAAAMARRELTKNYINWDGRTTR